MPYYRGDYYRGDPFLGPLIASVAGKAIKGLAGKAIKGVAGLFAKTPKVAQAATGLVRSAPFSVGVGAGLAGASAITSAMKERGGAMNGRGGGGGGRRMNVTNVKALRRAGRRVRGFLKLARRFGALPISPKGRKLFRARRRCK